MFSINQGRFTTNLVVSIVNLDQPLVPALDGLLKVAIEHITGALDGRWADFVIGSLLFDGCSTLGHLDAAVVAAVPRSHAELMESFLSRSLGRESGDFVGRRRRCWSLSIQGRQYCGSWLLLSKCLNYAWLLLLERWAGHFRVFVLRVALAAALVFLTVVIRLEPTLQENAGVLLQTRFFQINKRLAHSTQMSNFLLHAHVSTV